MTTVPDKWFTLRSMAAHLAVVIAVAATLPAQLPPRPYSSTAAVPACARSDNNMSPPGSLAPRPIVLCGFIARPIPGLDPSSIPDTGTDAPLSQDTTCTGPLLEPCTPCGVGVGSANLAVFGTLCALALPCLRLPRSRP